MVCLGCRVMVLSTGHRYCPLIISRSIDIEVSDFFGDFTDRGNFSVVESFISWFIKIPRRNLAPEFKGYVPRFYCRFDHFPGQLP